MHKNDKNQALYITLASLLLVIFLVLVFAIIECRQEGDLTACSVRWGNYGLSVQYRDQLVVWLLGFNDIRLWPLRQNIPLALFWSALLMGFSLAGLTVTLIVATIDHLFQIIRKSAS